MQYVRNQNIWLGWRIRFVNIPSSDSVLSILVQAHSLLQGPLCCYWAELLCWIKEDDDLLWRVPVLHSSCVAFKPSLASLWWAVGQMSRTTQRLCILPLILLTRRVRQWCWRYKADCEQSSIFLPTYPIFFLNCLKDAVLEEVAKVRLLTKSHGTRCGRLHPMLKENLLSVQCRRAVISLWKALTSPLHACRDIFAAEERRKEMLTGYNYSLFV